MVVSGKVYYEILAARKQAGVDDRIAIARLEQISPFPYDTILEECNRYKNAELVWAQEEHKNMGAWTFVQPRFNSLLMPYVPRKISLKQVLLGLGRAVASSTLAVSRARRPPLATSTRILRNRRK